MGRAPCCEKVGLKKGRWTAEEDKILTDYIQQNGEGSWRSLPKNAGTYLHAYPIPIFHKHICGNRGQKILAFTQLHNLSCLIKIVQLTF